MFLIYIFNQVDQIQLYIDNNKFINPYSGYYMNLLIEPLGWNNLMSSRT